MIVQILRKLRIGILRVYTLKMMYDCVPNNGPIIIIKEIKQML